MASVLPWHRVSTAGASLILCILFPSCGAVSNLAHRAARAGSDKPVAAPHNPNKVGWALLYPELAESEAPNAPSADGGTPTSATGGLLDFSSIAESSMSAATRTSWHHSASEAIEEAKQQGRLLFVLATNKYSQPASKLERTALVHPDFINLSREKFTLLRLDYSDDTTAKSPYYAQLKEKLKIRGYPMVVVLLPDGTHVGALRGYSSTPEYYAKRVQQLAEAGQSQLDQRRKRLEREGYRLWTREGSPPIFAKLSHQDANKLTFTKEWDGTFETYINRLSEADQKWIAEEQAKKQVTSQ